jgi:hypothetical protein
VAIFNPHRGAVKLIIRSIAIAGLAGAMFAGAASDHDLWARNCMISPGRPQPLPGATAKIENERIVQIAQSPAGGRARGVQGVDADRPNRRGSQ